MSDLKLDFIGIGANKAGTSWLNKMLQAHPQICTAEPKEVHFFHDMASFTQTYHQGNFAKGIEWYKRFFRHCHPTQVKGEITPKYLIDPVVPGRIKNMFPDVKLILCMRSPIERATSQYYFEKHFIRREKRPISEAIRHQPEYIEHGKYYAGIQRYIEYFPLSRIHLIWFEDIEHQPGQVMHDLYTFLKVDPSFVPPDLRKKSNASRIARWKWMRDVVAVTERKLTEWGMSGLLKWLKTVGVSKAIAMINSKPIRYDRISETDRLWLQQQFREDILHLQELTGRDLSTWLK
ncbi:MAG TPA: sulfotransferase domain-containing protein [Saprospiraceae bacterium]|nr:sulfotransferase domain-containing protein [Saprospiraceae bacterium]HQW24814.1 sulfotransferase domain-containing protein [Saprospiraceae bacterium]